MVVLREGVGTAWMPLGSTVPASGPAWYLQCVDWDSRWLWRREGKQPAGERVGWDKDEGRRAWARAV